MTEQLNWTEVTSVLSDSFVTLWTIAHQALPLSMDYPGKNIRVGCHFLLQGIFMTQGLNLNLLHLWHFQASSLLLVTPGKSWINWVIPLNPSLSVLTRRKKNPDTGEKVWEAGGRQWEDRQKTQESKREAWDFLQSPPEQSILPSARFQISGPQNCEKIDFSFFKPPSLW